MNNCIKVKRVAKVDDPIESAIEISVKVYARKKGFWVRKFASPSNRSVPDDAFMTPGGFTFFIEFKRAGKLPTDLQADEHRKIRANMGKVYIIDNITEGKAFIDRVADWKVSILNKDGDVA